MKIGICGKLGSGKTTTANYLVNNYGFKEVSFATPIKFMMAEYLGITDKSDPRYRPYAQDIGTDCFRSKDPDVWVNYLIKTVNKNHDNNYVISDIRFINEAKKLLTDNYLIIYLDCDVNNRIERCKLRDNGIFNIDTLNHSSETGVDDIINQFANEIVTVNNNESIKHLYKQIDAIMKIYKE